MEEGVHVNQMLPRWVTEELRRTSATSECLLHFMQGQNIERMMIAEPTIVEIMKSFGANITSNSRFSAMVYLIAYPVPAGRSPFATPQNTRGTRRRPQPRTVCRASVRSFAAK